MVERQGHLTGGSVRACMCAKSLQSYPTLCDPMDSSPPGSSVHGILQARSLESVAISFSNCVPYVNCKYLHGRAYNVSACTDFQTTRALG